MTSFALKQRIMAGVYVLYAIRRLKNPIVGELFVIGVFFIALSFLVSLPNIFSNILLTKGSYTFFVDAFSKTGTLVKCLLLSTFITSLLFIGNISFYTTNRIKARFV